MKQKTAVIVIVIMLLVSFTPMAAAKPVSSTRLIENNKAYNNKTVFYQGEVIGDIMVRGNLAWLTINDDAYSLESSPIRRQKLYGYNSGLPVTVPVSESQKIKFVGNYFNRGDIVLIKGIFHNACPEHNGALMIHGQELKVVKRGFFIKHPISRQKVSLTFFSLIIFLISAFIYYQRTPSLKRRWSKRWL